MGTLGVSGDVPSSLTANGAILSGNDSRASDRRGSIGEKATSYTASVPDINSWSLDFGSVGMLLTGKRGRTDLDDQLGWPSQTHARKACWLKRGGCG